ncbi:MAG: alpha/beta fold hydrolase [Planctomycetota bacterium]|nr:alpha/beta fold hydrolase [Planctomycetota bacterium]
MTLALLNAPDLAAEYPFESRFVDQDGVRQHYVDEGPRDGEPLLMLHGNPTWSFCFRKLVQAFSGEHRVVAPDHVGCGLSDKPSGYPYSLQRHVANLEHLVAELGLERITLVLHDWGGAIGMGFARRHPELVSRLVILNTAAFLARDIPLRISICRLPFFGPLAVRGLNAFVRAATFMAVAKPLPAEVKRGYLLPYDSYGNRAAVLAFVRDIPLAPDHPSYAELEAIDAALERFARLPTCIVWGERDWCFTPAFRAEWERRFPHAESHPIADAAHFVFEDAPDELIAHVRAFLARHPLP